MYWQLSECRYSSSIKLRISLAQIIKGRMVVFLSIILQIFLLCELYCLSVWQKPQGLTSYALLRFRHPDKFDGRPSSYLETIIKRSAEIIEVTVAYSMQIPPSHNLEFSLIGWQVEHISKKQLDCQFLLLVLGRPFWHMNYDV